VGKVLKPRTKEESMRNVLTALALTIAASTTASAQQPVPPVSAPPPAVQPQDPIASAQQRYAAWKQAKELCYRNAGVRSDEIRFDEGRKTFVIRDSVWLDPNRGPAAKACSTS
jgi:hypothetical protein